MSKILKSFVMIAAVAAVAGGATWAWFNTSATVSSNTFSADSMSLKIDSDPSSSIYTWSGGFTNPYDPFAKANPGSSGSQIMDIKNVAATEDDLVDGFATIKFNATSWSALGDNLNFTVSFDGNHDGTFDAPIFTGVSLAVLNNNTYTLGAITSPFTTDGTTLFGGKIASVKIDWSVPGMVGNEIAGQSVTFDTVFGLEQNHN